jgi:hypothetical protein
VTIPKEVEEHAEHGRKFFSGASCMCPVCTKHRERPDQCYAVAFTCPNPALLPAHYCVEHLTKEGLKEALFARFTEEEMRWALINMTDPRHHDECKHPSQCVCVDLDSRIKEMRRSRAPLDREPACPYCDGTKKILQDHDGRVGYQPCEACST